MTRPDYAGDHGAAREAIDTDNSPVAVEARLALAVQMLDAAVAELRALMSQLQTTTTTTTTTTRQVSPTERDES